MAEKSAARTRADSIFTRTEQRDAAVKDQLAKESAAFDARTAKLRALRLAKEAADAEARAVDDAANSSRPKKARVKRITTS